MTFTEFLISSSVLILLVILLRLLFRNRISRRVQYALWLVVLIRLFVPVQFGELSFSTSTAADRVEQMTAQQGFTTQEYAEYEMVYAHPKTVTKTGEALGFNYTYTTLDEMQLPEDIGETAEEPVDLQQIATAVWLCGTVASGMWFLLTNLMFRRKATKNLQELSVPDCPIPVYISNGIYSPCLIGLFRQKILLPPEAAQEPESLKHIIAHELTHRRHGDLVWGLLRCVLLCVYWYHPFVWLAATLSKKDCELACDEGAIARLGEEERIPYGETLLKMVSLSSVSRGVGRVATTMAESKKQLAQRILSIAKKRKFRVIAVIAVLCLLVAMLPVAFAGNKEKTEESFAVRSSESGSELALAEPCVYEGGIYEAYQKAITQTENVLDYYVVDLNNDGIYELALRRANDYTWDFAFYTYKDGKAIPLHDNFDDAVSETYTGGELLEHYADYDAEETREVKYGAVRIYTMIHNAELVQGEDNKFYVVFNTIQLCALEMERDEVGMEFLGRTTDLKKIQTKALPSAVARDLSFLDKVLLGEESRRTFKLPKVKLKIPGNWVEIERDENGVFCNVPVPAPGYEVVSDGKSLGFTGDWGGKTPNVLFLEKGRLEGWDDGEWGGGVRHRADNGEITDLINENFVSYYITSGRIFVFSGIVHGVSQGGVYEVYEENGEYHAKLVCRFDSAPRAVAAAGNYCFALMYSNEICVFRDGALERITVIEKSPYSSTSDTFGENMIYANGCLYVGKPGHIMAFDINEESFTWYVPVEG